MIIALFVSLYHTAAVQISCQAFSHQREVWVEDDDHLVGDEDDDDHLVGEGEVWVEDVAHAQHRPLGVVVFANCKNNQ